MQGRKAQKKPRQGGVFLVPRFQKNLLHSVTAGSTRSRRAKELALHGCQICEVYGVVAVEIEIRIPRRIRRGCEERGLHRRQIEEVDNTVFYVTWPGHVRIAGVADTVTVGIALVRIGNKRTVVDIVKYAIAIRVTDENFRYGN